MIEWKPIEEAPKDGTWVLVCNARLDARAFPLSIKSAKWVTTSRYQPKEGWRNFQDYEVYPTHYAEIGDGP